MKERTTKILFIIIFLIAIIIRIINFPNAISQINCDEAITAINAKSIAETGADIKGTTFPVYLEAYEHTGQSIMLTYIMALSIKLFGYSLFSVRFPMLIISLICIIVFYDLVKRVTKNEKIALLSMAMLAINPWHILQTIWSIDCNLFPHFLLISVYFLYRGITEKKYLIYISIIFFSLTMYTYGISIYIVPIFLIIFAIYLIENKKINISELISYIAIFILISMPIIIMYIINFFKIPVNIKIGNMTIQYFSQSDRNTDMWIFAPNILKQTRVNIMYMLKVIFIQNDRLKWNSTIYFGTTYHISIIFIIIAIIDLITTRKVKKDIGINMLIVWTILSVLSGILVNITNINRLNSIWYPLIALTVYGICVIYKKIKYKKTFASIVLIIYSTLFISYSVYFFSEYHNIIEDSWCFSRGFIDAVEYADSLNKESNYYFSQDATEDSYALFQAGVDNKKIEKITEPKEINERVNKINEKECYIIYTKYAYTLKNSNINIEEFNDYSVITKK